MRTRESRRSPRAVRVHVELTERRADRALASVGRHSINLQSRVMFPIVRLFFSSANSLCFRACHSTAMQRSETKIQNNCDNDLFLGGGCRGCLGRGCRRARFRGFLRWMLANGALLGHGLGRFAGEVRRDVLEDRRQRPRGFLGFGLAGWSLHDLTCGSTGAGQFSLAGFKQVFARNMVMMLGELQVTNVFRINLRRHEEVNGEGSVSTYSGQRWKSLRLRSLDSISVILAV